MKHAGIVMLLAAVLLAACEEKKQPYQPPLPKTGADQPKAEKSLEAAGRDREKAAEQAGR